MERARLLSNKRHQGSRDSHNVDRLSALPDEVICHVLSCLPTDEAVKTSILARRWRFLWAHVPILDLDSKSHHCDSDTINRVLLLHKVQSLNTFRLNCCHIECSDRDLVTWITTLVWRNVQNLDIHLNRDFAFMLPKSLFTCKTLVHLSLDFCVLPTLSGAVFLPFLKNLSLDAVEYVVEGNLPCLLSGCPVLEELTINKIRDPDLCCLNIFSPTLKRLSINSPFSGYVNEDPICGVNINASALKYLGVCDCPSEGISFSRPVTSLSEACLDLNPYTLEEDLKFLDNFCNVKCLNLSYKKNLDVLVTDSFAKFHNLTKLKLDADWRFLSYFLGNADNLQVLIIKRVRDLQCWMEPHQVPKCLLSRLRILTVDLLATKHELELIRYFLRNAKVLKRMEIYNRYRVSVSKAEQDSLKRISSFERASKECEFVFH